jgi:hypothetical protein
MIGLQWPIIISSFQITVWLEWLPRKVNGHVFMCYRSFDWSACTEGSEQSCIYVLQVFWLRCLYPGKCAVMYLRVTGLLIKLHVPREVSGHVFTCYRSFDWSDCSKGSEQSCIYVFQVFWLKYLYEGKWAVMYLCVTGLLMEVSAPREVSGHIFTCYRSFDWSACTKGSERSCIYVLHVFWLKCLYPGKWGSCIYVLQVFWLKFLYQGKWAVMYLRVTGLLIEVPVPREVRGHVFTCYRSFDWSAWTKESERSYIYVLHRSFDWSACTKGSERSCINVLEVF